MATRRTEEATLKIAAVVRETINVQIVGVTPVIPHKWSEKALRMMRDKQFGVKARGAREPKNPEEEAEAAVYRFPDGRLGLPATAFKASIVTAARLFSGITMTSLKTAVNVLGEGPDQLVEFEGEPTLREDTPRNATGVVDLRYRYSFYPWQAILTVEYLPAAIDGESIVNLIDAAGNGGVGDWRPSAPKSNTGTFGRFRIA